jgi:pentatricopeptide repeat protein
LLDEGMHSYASMTTGYMISAKLKHYTCMIDRLGHAGHVQEAKNMITLETTCGSMDRFAWDLQNLW